MGQGIPSEAKWRTDQTGYQQRSPQDAKAGYGRTT